LLNGARWPKAAWGEKGKAYAADVTEWPVNGKKIPLSQFLKHPLKPLSVRATDGFRGRASISKEIAWSPRFLDSLRIHAERLKALQED
jgi:DNA (cytosine-5)-methyltransferase 1